MKLISFVFLMFVGVSYIECQIQLPACVATSGPLPIDLSAIFIILKTVLNALPQTGPCDLVNTKIDCSLINGIPLGSLLCFILGSNVFNLQLLTCIATLLSTGYNLGLGPLSLINGLPLPTNYALCPTTINQLNCVYSFLQQLSINCANTCVRNVLLQLLCAVYNLVISLISKASSTCKTGLTDLSNRLIALNGCVNVLKDCNNSAAIDCLSIVKKVLSVSGGLPVGK